MRLFPREEKFYEFFLTQAKIILDASCLLLEGVEAGNSALAAVDMRLGETGSRALDHTAPVVVNTGKWDGALCQASAASCSSTRSVSSRAPSRWNAARVASSASRPASALPDAS